MGYMFKYPPLKFGSRQGEHYACAQHQPCYKKSSGFGREDIDKHGSGGRGGDGGEVGQEGSGKSGTEELQLNVGKT